MSHEIEDPEEFASMLEALRLRRREQNDASRGVQKRQSLKPAERKQVLLKTGGRCHICGGEISGKWHADHVLPHAAGGGHEVDNYLPACALCNNYRWNYLPEEFQHALKLGVWLRTEIAKGTPVGKEACEKFMRHEKTRRGRRKG